MKAMTLQQLLGIDLPIIQAPMAGVQGSALAVAVSDAGGLGSLPCAMLAVEAMRNELSAIEEQTRKPYAVNFWRRITKSSALTWTRFPSGPGARPSALKRPIS